MSSDYQPLHHKYRPQRFDQLVGQEAIAATLGHALTSNRIAPAYLFSGCLLYTSPSPRDA